MPNDLESRFGTKETSDAFAEDRVIVNDEYAQDGRLSHTFGILTAKQHPLWRGSCTSSPPKLRITAREI